jgi:YVTN family beta-propeller protein
VVNGSNRIEVIDVATRAHLHTIENPAGASPRHIAFDDKGVGYITNLYANTVSIYDVASRTITGEVAVGANPEGLLVARGNVLVANSGFGSGRSLSVISTATRTLAGSIPVGDNPQTLVALDASTALLLCTGAYNDWQDPTDDTPGMLYWIDLADRHVKDSLVLGGHPQRLAVDARGHAYTVADDGITRIDLATKQITPRFIPGFYYGLAVAPALDRIYVTEPLDYVQPGRFVIYTGAGVRLAAHDAGIIPGAIAVMQ